MHKNTVQRGIKAAFSTSASGARMVKEKDEPINAEKLTRTGGKKNQRK